MVELLTKRPVSALALKTLLERIDKDGDGTISKDEFFSAIRSFVLAGTSGSPTRRGRKRSAGDAAEATGEVRSRRRVLDDIRSFFDLSEASLDEDARTRLAMAAVKDEDDSSAMNDFERQIKAEAEAKAKAASLVNMERLLSEGGKAKRDQVKADVQSGAPPAKLSSLLFVSAALEAASDWSMHTKDRRVQGLVIGIFDFVRESKAVMTAGRLLASVARDYGRLKGNKLLLQAVTTSLRLLEMYSKGPGFMHLPESSKWHATSAWKDCRAPMLRGAVNAAGDKMVDVVLRVATTCPIHDLRRRAFKVLTALASFAGEGVPDFRVDLTKSCQLARVCCQRLGDVDHAEPQLNKEAISECLATMCGEGHDSPPHALDRTAYDRMGSKVLSHTVLERLRLDTLDLTKPELLVSTCKHTANLCNAFSHLLPSVTTQPSAWGFILSRAKPLHLHSEHPPSRIAAAGMVKSVLRLIALLLTNPADTLMELVLKPSPHLRKGLLEDVIIPVLTAADVSTEVKMKAMLCLSTLAGREATKSGLDPRTSISANPRLLGTLVEFVKANEELRVRSVVILERLASHPSACHVLVQGNVMDTLSLSLEQYRTQDADIKETIGVATFVYNSTLAKHALNTMHVLVRVASQARMAANGKPYRLIKHFVK